MSSVRAAILVVAVTACVKTAPPPPQQAERTPVAPPPAAPPPPPDAGGPPYTYPAGYRESFMEGCLGEAGPAAQPLCDCVYEKLRWHYTADDIDNDRVTETDADDLVAICVEELGVAE